MPRLVCYQLHLEALEALEGQSVRVLQEFPASCVYSSLVHVLQVKDGPETYSNI